MIEIIIETYNTEDCDNEMNMFLDELNDLINSFEDFLHDSKSECQCDSCKDLTEYKSDCKNPYSKEDDLDLDSLPIAKKV